MRQRLEYHPLSPADREAVQAVTLHTERRNCNYTFANLVGWQFLFHTEVSVLADAVVLRFMFRDQRAYMVCTPDDIPSRLIDALLEENHDSLTLMGLEDSQTEALGTMPGAFTIEVTPVRNQYDYIYRREDLATLRGHRFNGKRNHINRFYKEHPDFEYRPLTPELFDECRLLRERWVEKREVNDMLTAEQHVMENVFIHWQQLGMIGGSLFVDGRMVAFTYGAAVTTDTLDVCMEKADRHTEGAFSAINQQFAQHIPEQFVYMNREEDMGLPGLRKAKLSYHPEILLTYNVVQIKQNDRR